MSIRIVIGDPHPIVLDGLEHVFTKEVDFVLSGRCQTSQDLVDAVRQERPDILLFDFRMPEKGGLAVLRDLQEDSLPTKSILLSASPDEHMIIEAMRLGVRGVLSKSMDSRLFIKCIRKVHAGGQWLEQETSRQVLDRLVGTRPAAANGALSKREAEVVCAVAAGISNREIASRLFISEGTVKVHLHRIYDKLQIQGRLALSLYARERGLHLSPTSKP